MRYTGDQPSTFSFHGNTEDLGNPLSVTTGDAPDNITGISGSYLVVSTGGGPDTVRTGDGKEPISSSSINLGKGNDLFVPGFQSDGHLQTTLVDGNDGIDAVMLEPGKKYRLRGGPITPSPGEGGGFNSVELAGYIDNAPPQYYRIDDFERLRFETVGEDGSHQTHSFSLQKIMALESGYNDSKFIRFDPQTQQLQVVYNPKGTLAEEEQTVTFTSLEQQGTKYEATEVAPPGSTPPGSADPQLKR